MADAPMPVEKQNDAPTWTGGAPRVELAHDTLPANPKRVIRTFATDLAAVTAGRQAGFETKEETPTAEGGAVLGVELPAPATVGAEAPVPRLPPLQKQGAPMYVDRLSETPPAPPQRPSLSEGIVHEREPSWFSRFLSSLFNREPAYVPPVAIPQMPPPPPQRPTEETAPVEGAYLRGQEMPIAFAIPSSEADAAARDRDAVLARLRARVASYPEAGPPPVFPSPKPEDIPQYEPRRSTPLPDLGPLRTYSADLGAQVTDRSVSAFSVLASAADAPRPLAAPVPAPQSATHHGLMYALMGGVLMVGGSLLLYFGYTHFAAQAPVAFVSEMPPTQIAGDGETAITGSGAELMKALTEAGGANLPIGNVEVIYLSVSSTTPRGTTTLTLPGGDLIAALHLSAPDILLRNIGEASTVGIAHAGGETRPFFIIVSSSNDARSYERLFAGMLSWEPTIGTDLAYLYPSYAIAENASGTATSTATTTSIRAPGFVDEVVASHDVRALKDGADHTILIYGFRDRQTLIIARDENAFNLILARMSASQTQ